MAEWLSLGSVWTSVVWVKAVLAPAALGDPPRPTSQPRMSSSDSDSDDGGGGQGSPDQRAPDTPEAEAEPAYAPLISPPARVTITQTLKRLDLKGKEYTAYRMEVLRVSGEVNTLDQRYQFFHDLVSSFFALFFRELIAFFRQIFVSFS